MFRRRHDRDKDRYYLLPGMGGRSLRRKQRRIFRAAVAVGLVVSGLIALVLYLMNRQPN